MERLVLARHGESEYSARGLLNGEPATGVGLTARGEEEARRLGLADTPLELALHTGFPRTRATLELALAGREDVPAEVEPRLGDPRAGSLEGRTIVEYRAWAWNEGSRANAPGGGESRLTVASRYAAAYRDLLARPERTIFAVVHALPIAYVLLARDGEPPRSRMDVWIEYAQPYSFARAELKAALGVLDGWCESPSW